MLLVPSRKVNSFLPTRELAYKIGRQTVTHATYVNIKRNILIILTRFTHTLVNTTLALALALPSSPLNWNALNSIIWDK